MKENKNPITDENLEQVTGGAGLSSRCEAAAATVNAETARVAPAVGPAWAVVEHQQPSKTIGRLEPTKPDRHVHLTPTPTTETDPRSR